MSFTLLSFATQASCNEALNLAFLTELKTLLAQKDKAIFALSGGKSPQIFLQNLSQQEFAWNKCTISLVDERVASPTHEDSNAAFIRKNFLQNSAQRANFIPLLENANENLESLVQKANASFIQPDFALLGMGLDGHTASLFLDAKEFNKALKTEQNIIATSPTKAPHKRLSMSLASLEKCKKLFLLIAGKDKGKVFKEACENLELPISYILHSRKVQCDVYYYE